MIISPAFLQVFWFFAIGALLIIYACTAGFDFGTTMMLPFFRQEQHRRVMLNVITPTWDGNQTWIVFAGGIVFVIWPVVYASVFSGFYVAMILVVWAFFLRPPGFDYREKLSQYWWKRLWDWGLFISSFLPVASFGIIFGNLFRGVPIYFDTFTLRSYYHGGFWGLFNMPGFAFAVVALLMMLMHGAALQYRRTEGTLKATFKKLHRLFSLLFLIAFSINGLLLLTAKGYVLLHSPAHATQQVLNNVVAMHRGAWVQTSLQQPWRLIPVVVTYVAVLLSLWAAWRHHSHLTFWLSCVALASTVATAGIMLFPFVVPSSLHPNESLTVWNSSAGFYTLHVMFYVLLVSLAIVFAYKVLAYCLVWKKKATLNIDDIHEHDTY